MTWARIGTTAVIAAATLAAGTLAPAVSGAAAPPEAPRALISIGQFRASVSPNGDGFHDRLRIPFAVHQRSSVSAQVVNLDTRRTVYDGCLTADRHDCGFGRGRYTLRLRDLQTRSGSPWDPGTYRVRLTARTFAGLESDRARASFDVLPGTVRADHRRITFSPDGDGVRDRARIGFLLERRARVAAFLRPASDRGPAGVVRLGVRGRGPDSWTWDGRVGADVVPDGSYRLELRAEPVTGADPVPGRDELVIRVRTD